MLFLVLEFVLLFLMLFFVLVLLFIIVLAFCSLVLFWTYYVFCSWFLFLFWILGCVSGGLFFLLVACMLALLLLFVLVFCVSVCSCPREPVNIWKRMCCGPSSKSGHRKYDKILINLTDYIPFLWMRSQGYKHHFRPKPSDERGPTSSTPYNYTQPSARNLDDNTIRRQSFSTAGYRTTAWSSLEVFTGHAET